MILQKRCEHHVERIPKMRNPLWFSGARASPPDPDAIGDFRRSRGAARQLATIGGCNRPCQRRRASFKRSLSILADRILHRGSRRGMLVDAITPASSSVDRGVRSSLDIRFSEDLPSPLVRSKTRSFCNRYVACGRALSSVLLFSPHFPFHPNT